jgi:hypothetical protein
MHLPLTRRHFVTSTLTASALASLGDFAFLEGLPALAEEASQIVPLQSDIEPLVRLIEETDQKQLLEKIANQIRKGTSYQELLSAVFLAGVRGIQPRPVGFKFHAVLVINSAHLASLAATDRDRWLPLLWSIDNFKDSQRRNAREGNWHMSAVAEGKLPPATKARERFIASMDNWDEEGTDLAIAALSRTASANEIYELFWRYGCRDFRSIGHKAIFVANSYRALHAIGWRHAEPILRSLAYALLAHEGDNPAKRDADADRPFRTNQARMARMGPLNKATRQSAEAASDVLAVIRSGSPEEACDKVAELTVKGIHPSSIWDGLFLGAGELLMRRPDIVGLHCLTTANALCQGFQMTGSDETRRLLMLQGAAFLTMFRQEMMRRGGLGDLRIDALASPKETDPAEMMTGIFRSLQKDPKESARQTFALVSQKPEVLPELMKVARRLIFTKGNNAHDYKFSSAVLEDYYNVSPKWRPHFAAASVFKLRGSTAPDNDLIKRARAALST